MQVSYVHSLPKKYPTVFNISRTIDGRLIAVTYKFCYEIPMLANKAVVQYNNLPSSVDRVYDYGALIEADTVMSARKILEDTTKFRAYALSELTCVRYDKIMLNNVTVAQHLKHLMQQDTMLDLIDDM